MGFTEKSEEELMAELDSKSGGSNIDTPYLKKITAVLELQRRRVASLTDSSRRLEFATWVLVVLTLVWIALTALSAFRR